jgi:hypothetical protein
VGSIVVMKTRDIVLILFAFVGVCFGVWWFFIKDNTENVTPIQDPSFMIGRIYGTSNLSVFFEFLDSTTVKYGEAETPCTILTWELKTKTTLQIAGKGVFTIQSDSLKSADETYLRLTGDVSIYCDLVGKNV